LEVETEAGHDLLDQFLEDTLVGLWGEELLGEVVFREMDAEHGSENPECFFFSVVGEE